MASATLYDTHVHVKSDTAACNELNPRLLTLDRKSMTLARQGGDVSASSQAHQPSSTLGTSLGRDVGAGRSFGHGWNVLPPRQLPGSTPAAAAPAGARPPAAAGYTTSPEGRNSQNGFSSQATVSTAASARAHPDSHITSSRSSMGGASGNLGSLTSSQRWACNSAAVAALTKATSVLQPGRCQQLAALARLPPTGLQGQSLQSSSRPSSARAKVPRSSSRCSREDDANDCSASSRSDAGFAGTRSQPSTTFHGGIRKEGHGYATTAAAAAAAIAAARCRLPLVLTGQASSSIAGPQPVHGRLTALQRCPSGSRSRSSSTAGVGSSDDVSNSSDNALKAAEAGSVTSQSSCTSINSSSSGGGISGVQSSHSTTTVTMCSSVSSGSGSSSCNDSTSLPASRSSLSDTPSRCFSPLRPTKKQQQQREAAAAAAAAAAVPPVTDPEQWIHQQHPAIRCCIQADVHQWQEAQEQQQQQQRLDMPPGGKSTESAAAADATTAAAAAVAAVCSDATGKQAVGQLQLLQPQWPGTCPTVSTVQVRGSAGSEGFPGLSDTVRSTNINTTSSSSSRMRDRAMTPVQNDQVEDSSSNTAASGSSSSGNANAASGTSTIPLNRCKLLVRYDGVANKAVKQVFRTAGFRRTKGEHWSVLWGITPAPDMLVGLGPHQKVNHFPGTWELGRKDRLYHHLAAARRRLGPGFDFVPRFFIMPRDAEELRTDQLQRPTQAYIKKPVASSRGRGISVVPNISALKLSSLQDVLLQRYIDPPYLVNGLKFDLRVYVAVTSLEPLRVYVYGEGLVRFATEPYSTRKALRSHKCMHLTNYSVNKKARGYTQPPGTAAAVEAACAAVAGRAAAAAAAAGGAVHVEAGQQASGTLEQQAAAEQEQEQQQGSEQEQEQEEEGADSQGPENQEEQEQQSSSSTGGTKDSTGTQQQQQQQQHKWTFTMLKEHMQRRGHSWEAVWEQVEDIVAKTLIAVEPAMLAASQRAGPPRATNCFELFGFDVLLDVQRRAWLLEVNTTPALNTDSPLDLALKVQLVADLMHLVGVVPCDQAKHATLAAAERAARFAGLQTPATSTAAAAGGTGSKRSSQGGSGSSGGSTSRRLTNNSSISSSGSSKGSTMQPVQPEQGFLAGLSPQDKRAVSEALAAAADLRNVRDVANIDLPLLQRLCPDQLPEAVKETAAEERRQQGTSWIRVLPGYGGSAGYLQWLETPRLGNELLARYYRLPKA